MNEMVAAIEIRKILFDYFDCSLVSATEAAKEIRMLVYGNRSASHKSSIEPINAPTKDELSRIIRLILPGHADDALTADNIALSMLALFKQTMKSLPVATPQLPSAEKIAEAIYSIYGDKWPNASDHDKSICMREAQAVLDLLQAKPTIGIDMGAPGGDSTVFSQITKEGLRLLEKQLAVIQQPTRGSPIPLDPPDDEPEETEEKQPETESQYQDRLLRALRDFG